MRITSVPDAALPQIVPLFRGLHNYHVARLPEMFHASGPDSAYLKMLRAFVAQGDLVFGCEDNVGFVGYMLARIEQRRADGLLCARQRMRIDHLYVAPRGRNLGAGRALIAHLEQDMARRGLREWVVDHHAFNSDAARFYASVGAAPVRCTRRRLLNEDNADHVSPH